MSVRLSCVILRGFTLIELLIVVAIIGIIVTLALVNFRHARTRACVARAQADLHTLDVALHAYFADTGELPRGNYYQLAMVYWVDEPDRQQDWGLRLLSTPIAYTSQGLLPDPFETHFYMGINADPPRTPDDAPERGYYKYSACFPRGIVGVRGWPNYDTRSDSETDWYLLQSTGPDQTRYVMRDLFHADVQTFYQVIYDPTNGLHSKGSIYRCGGRQTCDVAKFVFAAVQQASP